jgi:hypothetical protein
MDRATQDSVREAGLCNHGSDREWLTYVAANVIGQLSEIALSVHACIDVHASAVGERRFKLCEWRDAVLHV